MEQAMAPENYRAALAAVVSNQGAPGIDRMPVGKLEAHLDAHWEKIRAKLLAGTYVPSPARRVEIPKPSGGTRMLGIPTVLDRFIQQLLLQVMTPIFEPGFSEHSYGFRPGRKAQDAVDAAKRYAEQGKDWVVDLDITKFLDTASQCTPVHERCSKSPGSASTSLIRKPLRLPRPTWIASSRPRFTRCNTVWRDTPSLRVASNMGR